MSLGRRHPAGEERESPWGGGSSAAQQTKPKVPSLNLHNERMQEALPICFPDEETKAQGV